MEIIIHKDVEEALDLIDASFFSGDTFHDTESLKTINHYLTDQGVTQQYAMETAGEWSEMVDLQIVQYIEKEVSFTRLERKSA